MLSSCCGAQLMHKMICRFLLCHLSWRYSRAASRGRPYTELNWCTSACRSSSKYFCNLKCSIIGTSRASSVICLRRSGTMDVIITHSEKYPTGDFFFPFDSIYLTMVWRRSERENAIKEMTKEMECGLREVQWAQNRNCDLTVWRVQTPGSQETLNVHLGEDFQLRHLISFSCYVRHRLALWVSRIVNI